MVTLWALEDVLNISRDPDSVWRSLVGLGYTIGFLAIMPGIGGCVTMNTGLTATTVGKGNTEIGLQPSAVDINPGGGVESLVGEVWGMKGVTDHWDLGGSAGTNGLTFRTRYRLSPSNEENSVVAIAPSVGGGGFPALFFNYHYEVPILIGFPFGRGHEIVFIPKYLQVGGTWGLKDTGQVCGHLFASGLEVGLSLELAHRFAVHPNFAMVAPIANMGTADVMGQSFRFEGETPETGITKQFSIGFVFGGE